jgi:hypothetical protein
MAVTLMVMEEVALLLLIGALNVPLPPNAAASDAPTVCSQCATTPTCHTYPKREEFLLFDGAVGF